VHSRKVEVVRKEEKLTKGRERIDMEKTSSFIKGEVSVMERVEEEEDEESEDDGTYKEENEEMERKEDDDNEERN
jgi:hypothetical protein